MIVSVFRHLLTNLFRGIGVEAPVPLTLPESAPLTAEAPLPPRTPFGIPDELAERSLPPGPILVQPQAPGD